MSTRVYSLRACIERTEVSSRLQLNRQTEQQGDTPRLSNLRESRAIEQDADVVALLHRDRKQQYDQKDGEEAKPLPAELIITKNRHGSCGAVNLNFFPEYFLFENATQNSNTSQNWTDNYEKRQ